MAMAAALVFGAAASACAQGDPRAGRRLAGGLCAVCHGTNGIAVQADAPNLAGQNPIYVAIQLRAYRDGRRQHEQMAIIARGLTDEQISDLAAWFAAIEVSVNVPPR
jgi:cytochrome c553